MPQRLSQEHINSFVSQLEQTGNIDPDTLPYPEALRKTQVLIAGSGPIG